MNNFIEVIKEKNFLKIWSSQLLSQITVNMINFVLILHIFNQTGSTVAVSLFWFFWALPAIFLGPFSGTLIDLFGTRRILILTNLVQSLIILLYLLVRNTIWPIYSIVFLYSISNQFYAPAEAATLPGVCPKKLLTVGNSLFLFTTYVALIFGFGLAGPLIKLVGPQIPFLLGSILLICAATAVWLLPKANFSKPLGKFDTKKLQEFLGKLNEGYRFIKTSQVVLFPLLLLVFSQIIITMLFVLGPALVVKILGTPFINISQNFILPGGLGAIVGMVLAVKLLKKSRKRYLITSGLFLSSFVFFSLALIVPHFTDAFKVIGQITLGFLAGFSFSIFTIPTQTLLQEKTPIDMRGRVFGVLGFLITIASVLPVLFAATVGEILGEVWMILILAIIVFSLGIFSLKGENVIQRFYRS
ncbi:MAG: MFS transporter [Candidatus Shapirobacteria bacterium]|nr:MFS transporter [Candidatus Shapirobacteria bacterium]